MESSTTDSKKSTLVLHQLVLLNVNITDSKNNYVVITNKSNKIVNSKTSINLKTAMKKNPIIPLKIEHFI